MNRLLSEPLFYIYFVYGVSFLLMSLRLVGGILEATSSRLVSSFYMLIMFGVFHGITELTDWVRIIGKSIGFGENELLLYSSPITLIISFVFLLQFGVNLMTYKSEKKDILRTIPIVLLLLFSAAVLILGISDVRQVSLFARYSFGFTGAALSAIMLFWLGNAMKAQDNEKLTRGLYISATGFAVYAVCGGLIVTPLLGLPIQLFRAASAVVITFSANAILGVFKIE
jgi:hypothetical protein